MVPDIQLSMMSSRRQSVFPPAPSRLSSFSRDQFYSSSSPTNRRPSEGILLLKSRKRKDPYDQHIRRASCMSKLSQSYSLDVSPTLRRSAYQSERRDAIQEEASDSEHLRQPSVVQAFGIEDELQSKDERCSNYSSGSSSDIKKFSLVRIPSLSTRFSDV